MLKALPLEGDFKHPRALLLGSFPGAQSLEQRQYYAHPRNLFWPLLASAHGEKIPSAYRQRILLLKRHHLALCDVLGGCRRKGSLDSAIKNAAPNREVKIFLRRFPGTPVFFTSQKARALFVRFFAAESTGRKMACLPSPSPANMAQSLAEKKRKWKKALRTDGGRGL